MCGIAGYFSQGNKPSTATAVAIAILAREMETRGDHSWGCTDGEMVNRKLGKISKGFAVPKRLPSNFTLHTRFATTGKVKESNSHPFVVQREGRMVVGMHNGIISNHSTLNQKYGRTCRVDSQHIFENIASGFTLNDLEGYGTIVYRDAGEWYIGTFNGGEIAIAQTSAGIFFASTFKALDGALLAAGLEPSKRDLLTQDDTIYKLTPAGLVVAYTVNVKDSFARWDDDWKLKSKSWGTTFGPMVETCETCGDYLPPEATGSLCRHCAAFQLDWDTQVVPEDMFAKCEDCGLRVEAGEEVAVLGDTYLCIDCATKYDDAEVNVA